MVQMWLHPLHTHTCPWLGVRDSQGPMRGAGVETAESEGQNSKIGSEEGVS